uniref:G domain-containing protein n=1 Tax=Acrobeloides nanus TaxID=290746 RepID=A0A914BY04_9BILA
MFTVYVKHRYNGIEKNTLYNISSGSTLLQLGDIVIQSRQLSTTSTRIEYVKQYKNDRSDYVTIETLEIPVEDKGKYEIFLVSKQNMAHVRFVANGTTIGEVNVTLNENYNLDDLILNAMKKGMDDMEVMNVRIYAVEFEEYVDIEPPFEKVSANATKYEIVVKKTDNNHFIGEERPKNNIETDIDHLVPKAIIHPILGNAGGLVRQSSNGECIKRQALGRLAGIGELYNYYTDNFCGRTVLCADPPKTAITQTDTQNTNTDFILEDSINERFKNFEVEGELKLSFLSGAVNVAGHGRYLAEKRESERETTVALVCRTTTMHERINVNHPSFTGLISLDAVQNTQNATHIVVGIQWGAVATAKLSYQNKEQADEKVIKGELQATLIRIKLAASGKGNYEERNESKTRDFRFQFYADALFKDKCIPTTVEEAVDFVKTFPQAIFNANGGRGVPIIIERIICKVDELTIQSIARLFDDMEKSQRQLYDIMVDFEDNENSKCVPQDQLTKVRSTFNLISESLSLVRKKVQEKLVDVRTGNANVSKMNDIVNEIEQSECSRTKVVNFIDSLKTIRYKIQYVKYLQSRNVAYIGRGSLLDQEKARYRECYIHFCTWMLSEKSYAENQQCFKSLIEDKHNCIFVDLQIRPELASSEGVADGDHICHYSHGSYISADVTEDIRQEKMLCIVKSSVPREVIDFKPPKRVILEIICPGALRGCCERRDLMWCCNLCLQYMEYGLDDGSLYCLCGKAEAHDFLFRCNDRRHGQQFRDFPLQDLINLLDKIRPYKEYNVLILGETGVGKSTWINAFANYITFEDLEEAKSADPVYLIPSKFLMTDSELNDRMIQIGEPENECFEDGMSCTQEPRVHVFHAGKKVIRLIDTPGMGDTRGLEQDQKNMASILGFIAPIKELHCICILLKPNNDKMSTAFRYCINELLTHLHKDAAKNIVFCFTNARASFYGPGDTKRPLERYLNEIKDTRKVEIPVVPSTVYSLDNEAFRFLCALHKGVKFTEDQYLSFSQKNNMKEGVLQPITPNQITELRDELMKLHHFGEQLADLETHTINGNEAQIRYTEKHYDHTAHQRRIRHDVSMDID